MTLSLDRFASPVGEILLVFEGETLRALDFWDYEPRMQRLLRLHYGAVSLTEAAAPAAIRAPLGDFFEGDWAALDRIAVATGGTPFQRMVWAELRHIRPGTTAELRRGRRRRRPPGREPRRGAGQWLQSRLPLSCPVTA